MLECLKEKVYIANQDLIDLAAYPFSWVSVSAIDREKGLIVMMPDGGALREEDMAVVDLQGNVLEGKDPPVEDTAIHLALYRQFPEIGSIAHPYSRWATVFAQLTLNIPTLGTIHAGTFHGDIPTTQTLPYDALTIAGDIRIADAIADAYRLAGSSPEDIPAVLVSCHGAYTFGEDARTAVLHANMLDETAFLAYHTLQIDPGIQPLSSRSEPIAQ